MVEIAGIDSDIFRISPKIEDLIPNKQLNCPEPNCTSVFSNSGNLQMHLERHHQRKLLRSAESDGNNKNGSGSPKSIKWYFCPVVGCQYYDTGSIADKHFGCLKYVRQHFQKVHAIKSFQCKKCGKTFCTNLKCTRHENDCGRIYKCETCGWTYNVRETLITHSKRKGHAIDLEKIRNTSTKSTLSPDTVIIGTQTISPIQILVKLSTQTRERGIQTDPVEFRESQKRKRVATKSSGQSVGKKSKFTEPLLEIQQPAVEAQRNLASPAEIQNSNQIAVENNLNRLNFFEESNDDDKTLIICMEQQQQAATNPSTSTSGLCDIETQTEKYNNSFLDLYSHMHRHTQTCDDFLSELGLANIQTQTNLSEIGMDEDDSGGGMVVSTATRDVFNLSASGPHDEMLVSTETQTSFTQCLLEYKEAAASTNSNGITQHTQTCETLLEGLFGGQESDLIQNFQSTYTQT